MTIYLPTLQVLNFADVAESILQDGGISVHIPSGSHPVDGYMVALPGHEVQVPRWLLDGIAIADFVRQNSAVLEFAYLGGWVDGDTVYLDASVNIPDRDTAVMMGRAYSQLAIYDVTGDTSIYL